MSHEVHAGTGVLDPVTMPEAQNTAADAAVLAELDAQFDEARLADLEIRVVNVAKAGGTSMAQPEKTANRVENGPEGIDVLITSAAGKAPDEPVKVTDMLLGYKKQEYSATDIQRRYEAVLSRTGMDEDRASLELIDRMPDDLASWASHGDPIEALGEYWSAKLYALQTGRQFVDARHLIYFDSYGEYDEARSTAAIKAHLQPGGRYVVPGFYGSNPEGGIQVFERGGSDISGACVAKALNAQAYYNMSDVRGFLTANPKLVSSAQYLHFLSYGEGRGLAAGGNELLHRQVGMILGGTGIPTFMVNTFGDINLTGTEVTDKRGNIDTVPIVGVTGRELIAAKIGRHGLNEGYGRTNAIYDTLEKLELPFERGHDGLDNIAMYFDPTHADAVSNFEDEMRRQGNKVRIADAALIHIVGEGLRDFGPLPIQAMGRICMAFEQAGIVGMGTSGISGSAELSLYINPRQLELAVETAHGALGLDKITSDIQIQR